MGYEDGARGVYLGLGRVDALGLGKLVALTRFGCVEAMSVKKRWTDGVGVIYCFMLEDHFVVKEGQKIYLPIE